MWNTFCSFWNHFFLFFLLYLYIFLFYFLKFHLLDGKKNPIEI